MSQQPVIHSEQMSADELQFLISKDEKETRLFYKAISALMVICFILPFIVAWVRAFAGDEQPFEFGYYFLGVGFLLSFLGFCSWLAYRFTLQKIRTDIKKGTKTVERTIITRKQYMPHNNSFYFYLDSATKLSIEVSQNDYLMFSKGDELNIEYSTNAKFYFGYF
ncbi:MAG: hypothetical protein H6550_07730 [Chitinophagales bacterium]|nr:hypothetical protein [Chitinophagales bacterium]